MTRAVPNTNPKELSPAESLVMAFYRALTGRACPPAASPLHSSRFPPLWGRRNTGVLLHLLSQGLKQ